MATSAEYVINTGSKGILDSTTAVDIDHIVSNLKAQRRSVLYFHGGLVPLASGMAIAEKLKDKFLDAGNYPVFFVYESGLLEILRSNLPEIAGEAVFKSLLNHLLGKVVGSLRSTDGTRGFGDVRPTDMEISAQLQGISVGREPFRNERHSSILLSSEDTTQNALDFQRELAADEDLITTLHTIGQSAQPEVAVAESARGIPMRTVASPRTLMSPDIVAELSQDVSAPSNRGLFTGAAFLVRAAKVLIRIIGRFRHGRDHGVYPTVVEELLREFYVANVGEAVWTAIKQETSDTFESDTGDLRGGDIFLTKMGAMLKELGPDNYPKISLVGHSTGAVFINNLLHAVAARQDGGTFPGDFSFEHIVLLAPACTYAAFSETLGRKDKLFRSCRLFGMLDEVECKDAIVPFVYTRSLLYFVSGVVENPEGSDVGDVPILGMNRFFSLDQIFSSADQQAIRTYIGDQATHGSVWSIVAGTDGLSSSSQHHGDFDDDPVTIQSLCYILTL